MQRVRRGQHLPAQSAKEGMQRVRRGEHLPAQSEKEPVLRVRRGEHLRAQSEKERVLRVRRGEHLRAQSGKVSMQGLQRGGHLRAQSDEVPVQDVQSRKGRGHASRSRGALRSIHTMIGQVRFSFRPPIVPDGSTSLCEGRAAVLDAVSFHIRCLCFRQKLAVRWPDCC